MTRSGMQKECNDIVVKVCGIFYKFSCRYLQFNKGKFHNSLVWPYDRDKRATFFVLTFAPRLISFWQLRMFSYINQYTSLFSIFVIYSYFHLQHTFFFIYLYPLCFNCKISKSFFFFSLYSIFRINGIIKSWFKLEFDNKFCRRISVRRKKKIKKLSETKKHMHEKDKSFIHMCWKFE